MNIYLELTEEALEGLERNDNNRKKRLETTTLAETAEREEELHLLKTLKVKCVPYGYTNKIGMYMDRKKTEVVV